MKKQSALEKYFIQKRFTAFEIILIVLCAMSFFLAMIRGGGIYGLTSGFIILIPLMFLLSGKIQDEEVDDAIARIILENGIDTHKPNVFSLFDLRAEKMKKGKDGKFRSEKYVILELTPKMGGNLLIVCHYINVIKNDVVRKEYFIDEENSLELREELERDSFGIRHYNYLFSDLFPEGIPYPYNEYKSSELIKDVLSARNESFE